MSSNEHHDHDAAIRIQRERGGGSLCWLPSLGETIWVADVDPGVLNPHEGDGSMLAIWQNAPLKIIFRKDRADAEFGEADS